MLGAIYTIEIIENLSESITFESAEEDRKMEKQTAYSP